MGTKKRHFWHFLKTFISVHLPLAEILEKISLVFWEIWRHQRDILKLTDIYFGWVQQHLKALLLKIKAKKVVLSCRLSRFEILSSIAIRDHSSITSAKRWVGWPIADVCWQGRWVGVAKCWREQKIRKKYPMKKSFLFLHRKK